MEWNRFAEYLSEERRARFVAAPEKRCEPTTKQVPQKTTRAAAALPKQPSKAGRQQPKSAHKNPQPLQTTSSTEEAKEEPSSTTTTTSASIARDLTPGKKSNNKNRASQEEEAPAEGHPIELAYVTFPYYPSLSFFDNPFEFTHRQGSSTFASPTLQQHNNTNNLNNVSYTDSPVYASYSYVQAEYDDSFRRSFKSSYSALSTSDDELHHEELYANSNRQLSYGGGGSYPQFRSYSPPPACSYTSGTQLHDYLNIFS